MDYGILFKRAWDIIWKNKFLILLGMMVVLGSASGSGGTQGGLSSQRYSGPQMEQPRFQFEPPVLDLDIGGFGIALVIVIALIVFGVLAGLWVLSLLSRGALIDGAAAIDSGETSSFSQAFAAGWEKGLRLIGIGLVPAIPTLLLIIVSGFSILRYTSVTIVNGSGSINASPNWLVIPAITVICFLAFASLVLALLRTFANRACMLEDLGVFASYRRGLQVLGENFGSALLLFVLQILLSLTIGIILLVPGIVVALCCLLWPLLLIVQGIFAAYYSTLWTLAWNRWTEAVA